MFETGQWLWSIEHHQPCKVVDHDAKRYYEQFGFVSLPSNELELFLPVKSIQDALTSHP